MVHSKVEMPHHFISSRGDEVSLHSGLRGKVALRKLPDDVIGSKYNIFCYLKMFFIVEV